MLPAWLTLIKGREGGEGAQPYTHSQFFLHSKTWLWSICHCLWGNRRRVLAPRFLCCADRSVRSGRVSNQQGAKLKSHWCRGLEGLMFLPCSLALEWLVEEPLGLELLSPVVWFMASLFHTAINKSVTCEISVKDAAFRQGKPEASEGWGSTVAVPHCRH